MTTNHPTLDAILKGAKFKRADLKKTDFYYCLKKEDAQCILIETFTWGSAEISRNTDFILDKELSKESRLVFEVSLCGKKVSLELDVEKDVKLME